jgi:hypothetical protein
MDLQVTKNLDFTGDSIYVGIDVHKKQWNVSIMGEFKEHKTFVQPPDAVVLGRYLVVSGPMKHSHVRALSIRWQMHPMSRQQTRKRDKNEMRLTVENCADVYVTRV